MVHFSINYLRKKKKNGWSMRMIWRGLSVHLNYFLPAAPDAVHEHPADASGFLQICEGHRGHLELLHPCGEVSSMTKYQALLATDSGFGQYRKAFSFLLTLAEAVMGCYWAHCIFWRTISRSKKDLRLVHCCVVELTSFVDATYAMEF